MKRHDQEFKIRTMSRVLKVSHSGYYDWLKRQARGPSPREHQRQARDGKVRATFEAHKGRSRSPNITHLHEAGERCDRKTVAASMQRQGLRAKAAKKFVESFFTHHESRIDPGQALPDSRTIETNGGLNTLKSTTIGIADTELSVTSARWTLRQKRSLSNVSFVVGQDQSDDGVYMASFEKTLTKVTAAVLYSLQARHSIFSKVDAPELERFVLQVYSSAPAHIKLAFGGLSFYINILGLLLFLKPVASLSLKQVSGLIYIMDASSFGVLRAYSRFVFNIVSLGALSENQYVS